MKLRLWTVGVLLAALTPFHALSDERPGATWAPTVAAIPSPAAANSAQPQLFASGDRAVLSWIERSGESAALRFSERTASGWAEARTVASGTNWFVNWADVPSVIPLERGGLLSRLRRAPSLSGIMSGTGFDGLAIGADLVSALEARALWSRYGL